MNEQPTNGAAPRVLDAVYQVVAVNPSSVLPLAPCFAKRDHAEQTARQLARQNPRAKFHVIALVVQHVPMRSDLAI